MPPLACLFRFRLFLFITTLLPSHTIDEVAGLHAALAVLLELKELELEVLAVDV
jgi:hypothetical protein